MARNYKKRSDYWKKFEPKETSLAAMLEVKEDGYTPELVGESFYQSVNASRLNEPTSRSGLRENSSATNYVRNRFKNIDEGLLPFDYSKDSVSVKDAITLCQKAYFNIPAFRSTIDMLSEFADADIYLDGGTTKSQNFVNAWFNRIKLHDLKLQFFREYYRSGNVFMYRIDGKLKVGDAGKMLEAYGTAARNTKIPIKYLIINPTDIAAKGSISFSNYQYFKVLTPYEISRLRDPQTDYEKELFKSLPEDVQVRIRAGAATTSERLYMKLDSDIMHVVFAKKQDYEPMSVPSCFAVLDDINKKIELKKIDQAISRSIENVVLLVTMGAEPDKGGINHRNLAAMQEIFKNQSVGRVLVSDYTTKADFVIPDLRKVVGPEKYEILNKDIEQGLQNILIGDSKYADSKLKMKVFMNRLEESREAFLKDFLQPEIKRICKAAGMRSWPTAKFSSVDVLDQSDLAKLVTRMMELGVLTPEQGMETLGNGNFPNSEKLESAQQKLKDQREEGYYMPLVNSINLYQEGNAPATPASNQIPSKKVPTKISPSGGRPLGVSNSNAFSKKNIIEATKQVNEFELKAFAEFAIKYGIDELTEDKKDIVSKVCESIVVARENKQWESSLTEIVEDFSKIEELNISQEVLEVGARHQLDDLSAAILYHSTKIKV
jgi:hypothetical protein